MKKKAVVTLQKHEKVLAVVPEKAEGPGWSNILVWVYVGNHQTNTFRSIALQAEDFGDELWTLFKPGVAIHEALTAALKIESE